MTRRRAFALLATAASLVATISAVPSHALRQEGFHVPVRATVVKDDYQPIPAFDPASVTIGGVVGPDECEALPSCALIPFTIERPTDIKPGDDFYLVLEVHFDVPTGAEDLDVYVYDNGQEAEAEGSSGYTEKGSSASADNPELIKLFEPLLGEYNLVVQNFSGVAVTYSTKAQSFIGVFVPPQEMLAPAPGQGTTNPRNKPTTTTTTTTPPPSTTSTVSIPEGVVLPDDDYDSGAFAEDDALADQLAAVEELAASQRGRQVTSPSAMTVLLWMIGLPAIVLGAAAFLVARRRRSRRASAVPAV